MKMEMADQPGVATLNFVPAEAGVARDQDSDAARHATRLISAHCCPAPTSYGARQQSWRRRVPSQTGG